MVSLVPIDKRRAMLPPTSYSFPPAMFARQRASYSQSFKIEVVRSALRLPPNARIKPTCRAFPGIEPVQVRKWIKNFQHLVEATAAENSPHGPPGGPLQSVVPPPPSAASRNFTPVILPGSQEVVHVPAGVPPPPGAQPLNFRQLALAGGFTRAGAGIAGAFVPQPPPTPPNGAPLNAAPAFIPMPVAPHNPPPHGHFIPMPPGTLPPPGVNVLPSNNLPPAAMPPTQPPPVPFQQAPPPLAPPPGSVPSVQTAAESPHAFAGFSLPAHIPPPYPTMNNPYLQPPPGTTPPSLGGGPPQGVMSSSLNAPQGVLPAPASGVLPVGPYAQPPVDNAALHGSPVQTKEGVAGEISTPVQAKAVGEQTPLYARAG